MGAENYTLGKGILYFNRWQNAAYAGWKDLGNAPAFSFNVNIEKLEHFSSRGGLKVKDKEIISQLTPSLSFTLDEITPENFALLGLATIADESQSAGSVPAGTPESLVVDASLIVTLKYRDVSNVVVKDQTDAVTYVAGTDYTISPADAKAGRIVILATGGIHNGDTIHVSYDYAAATYKKVKMFTETEVTGQLRFESANPTGTQLELFVPRVSLTMNGEVGLISEDWTAMSFTGEIQKSTDPKYVDSPYMSITMKPAA